MPFAPCQVLFLSVPAPRSMHGAPCGTFTGSGTRARDGLVRVMRGGADQRLEQLQVAEITGCQPLGMPVHPEDKRTACHFDSLDHAVGRDRAGPPPLVEPLDQLMMMAVDRHGLFPDDLVQDGPRHQSHRWCRSALLPRAGMPCIGALAIRQILIQAPP